MKNSIGLGTAAIGRPLYININPTKNTASFSLAKFKGKGISMLNAAYAQGVRNFDTSPGYGLAEDLLIDWIKEKNDSSIHISTKWGYKYVANFDPNATIHEVKEHSLEMLNSQWNTSKELLPYLKIYQIHSATFDTGVLDNHDILNRLHELKKEFGIIIGLSTTGENQVEVLKKALTINIDGERLFQSIQCTFNILDQSILAFKDELISLKGPIIVKEALANGRLFPNTKFPHYSPLYNYLVSLSDKYKVGIDAISLNFCLINLPSALILSGANNREHLKGNLMANTFSLSELEVEKLKFFGIKVKDYWDERQNLAWN